MATYYSTLEAARTNLGVGSDLGPFLMIVAKHPHVKTAAELAHLFAARANVALSSQQLEALVEVIEAANADTSEPEVDLVETNSAPDEALEEEPAVGEKSAVEHTDEDLPLDEVPEDELPLDETPQVQTPQSEEPSLQVEAPVEADDVEPGLSPEDFRTVDISAGSSDFLTVTTNEAGKFEVTWPKADGAVFVLAVGEKRFPDAIESGVDEIVVLPPTTQNTKTFASEFRYVSVFRFDEPGKPGYKIGQGRALGRLLSFEAQKNPSRITLTWQTDDPEATVVIFKSEPNKKLPKVPTSEPTRKAADSFWNDVMVEVGETFEYRAHLEWRFNEGTPADTTEKDAISLKVVVPGAVPRIEKFSVQRNPSEEHLTIRLEDITKKGVTLEIYQNIDVPKNRLVARGNTQFSLDEFNDKQFQEELGSKVLQNPEIEDGVRTYKEIPLLRTADDVIASTITYTAVCRLGNDVYITKPFVLRIVDDLEILGLEDFYDYHLMRLEVPTGATTFEVWITDLEKEFDDVRDLLPSRTFIREEEYDVFGGLRFEKNDLAEIPRKIFVRGTSAYFDGQNNEGQHREFYYPGRVTVKYKLKQQNNSSVASKGGLFGRGKQPATSAPIQQKLEFFVEYPQYGLDEKNKPVYLSTLTLQQLKALEPKFPMIKRNNVSDQYHAFATITLANFSPNGAYQELVSQAGAPIQLDQPGRNRFVAYFDDATIKTKIFVINEDDELAMNGDNLQEPPGRAVIPNPARKLKIAIVGAKASGKTTYLAALLQYLEHQFGSTFGGKLIPKPGDSKAQARSTQLANFVRSGQPLPPTDSAINFTDVAVGTDVEDPRTTFSYKMLLSANSPVGEFEFLDLAGEDLSTTGTLELYKKDLQEADLIIFLFDQLQQPEVRRLLIGAMAVPQENAAQPAVIWGNLKEVIGPIGSRTNPNQKVAIAISKFDAVQLAMETGNFTFQETIDSAMAINRDPYATHPVNINPAARRDFNYRDAGDVHAETKALLRLIKLAAEADLDEDPMGWPTGNVKYFVVSALGQGIKGRTHGLSSFRIGDPIRWALANNS